MIQPAHRLKVADIHSNGREELANASQDHENTNGQVDYTTVTGISTGLGRYRAFLKSTHKMSEKSIAKDQII